MLMLLFIALGVLMAAAAITTVFALFRAKDGYEDETGFHFGVQPCPPRPALRAQPEWLRHLYAVFKKPVALDAPSKHRADPIHPGLLAAAKSEDAAQPVPASIR